MLGKWGVVGRLHLFGILVDWESLGYQASQRKINKQSSLDINLRSSSAKLRTAGSKSRHMSHMARIPCRAQKNEVHGD